MRPFEIVMPGLAASLLPLLLSCGVSEFGERLEVPPQDPRWATVLSNHTRGMISRRDKIRLVFAVAHRDPDAVLFWHLDDQFLGTTRAFHEKALDIPPGSHTITVVDQAGNRMKRELEVLAKGS